MKPSILFLTLVAVAAAQDPRPSMKCNDDDRNGRQSRHCEIREQTIAYGGLLNIDGRDNGGVAVHGWTRADVLVRMKMEASADNESEARSLVNQIRPNLSAGRVSADGPTQEKGRNWSVSYEIFAPSQSNLEISARNGGISISDVRGNITFATVNGGVSLARVNGNVKGQTTNGGVHVKLDGSRWDGNGLDLKTTNGGVTLEVPSSYSAQLETSTVNGGLRSDFGGSLEAGRDKVVRTAIGSGGAPIRIITTNGGVKVTRI